jgi:hypothetical protein
MRWHARKSHLDLGYREAGGVEDILDTLYFKYRRIVANADTLAPQLDLNLSHSARYQQCGSDFLGTAVAQAAPILLMEN